MNPAYQLIIVGQFANARYLSVTNNDAHSAPAQFILDQDIVPLTPPATSIRSCLEPLM